MQVTRTPPISRYWGGGGGGYWLPVFPLLTTCKAGTSNLCRYGEYSLKKLSGSAHVVFKAVRVLARMCPCADSYEPSLLERNIRLLKIVILLFFSVRFYFSADFLSRFKAVRVLARMCPCADSYEPSLLERNIRLLKIVIFLFSALDFILAPIFYPVSKQ